MVSCKLLNLDWGNTWFWRIRGIPYNNCSWISSICANQFISNKKTCTNCRSWKLNIKTQHVKLIIWGDKSIMKRLLIVVLWFRQILFQKLRKSLLDICRHFFSILSMSITHRKEMTALTTLYVWVKNKVVLIDLHGVIWNEPDTSGKSKLCHYIGFIFWFLNELYLRLLLDHRFVILRGVIFEWFHYFRIW